MKAIVSVLGKDRVGIAAAVCTKLAEKNMINSKTTAVRLIPAPGKGVGDAVEFGGLFGSAPVQRVNPFAGTVFAHRGGRFPAPLNSLKN